MRGIIFILFGLLLLLPSVSAYEVCTNSTQRLYYDVITINGADTVINGTEPCPYGCAGGQCRPTRSGDTLSLAVIFLAIIFGFLYIGTNVPEKSAYLSWIFIPLSILFMAVGLFFVAAQSVFEENINASISGIFYAIIMILILIFSIFLISLVVNLFRKVTPYGKGKY